MSDWLVDPDHPALSSPNATRLDDASRPDRLTWNAFHTLGQWNTDVWVPALLEEGLGADNPISGLEWSDASVEVWRVEADLEDAADVVLTGREATVLVEATFLTDVTVERLFHGVRRALGLAGVGRQAGYVMVLADTPEGLAERLDDVAGAELSDFDLGDTMGLRPDALVRICGWVTWRDLGTLAIDLAEEADPIRGEQVHNLVTELQRQFPDVEF